MVHAIKQTLASGDENRFLTVAVLLSLVGHILLFTVSHVLTTSGYKHHKTPRSIDVDLVQTELPVAKPTEKSKKQPKSKASSTSRPTKKTAQKKLKKTVTLPTKTTTAKKTKKSRQKVVTPNELVQNALQKMAKEASKPEPLSQRLDRLKQEVNNRETAPTTASPDAVSTDVSSSEQISIKERYYRTIEVIIRKNWAFPVQSTRNSNDLKTQIIFTVMPDGSVPDAWVSQRSGNANFDRSALSAVNKSTPLPPYPAGIKERKIPFVINFDIGELL